MKYGIFSDIHSNLEAFNTVLDYLKETGVDSYVFVGDIVGYGAEPRQCLKQLRDLVDHSGCTCVAGNHDYAVVGMTDTTHYDPYAKVAIEWTRDVIDKSDKEFLTNLQLVQQVENFTVVHANLSAPEQWGYIFDIDDAYSSFKCLQNQVCFIGHSHRPIVFTSGEIVDWSVEDNVRIKKDVNYIINVGSVGQPRDGNPKSSFAIYDTEAKEVQIKRLEYDVSKTQAKILEAGLPKVLAERLSLGK